jgi:hypothetical protein
MDVAIAVIIALQVFVTSMVWKLHIHQRDDKDTANLRYHTLLCLLEMKQTHVETGVVTPPAPPPSPLPIPHGVRWDPVMEGVMRARMDRANQGQG